MCPRDDEVMLKSLCLACVWLPGQSTLPLPPTHYRRPVGHGPPALPLTLPAGLGPRFHVALPREEQLLRPLGLSCLHDQGRGTARPEPRPAPSLPSQQRSSSGTMAPFTCCWVGPASSRGGHKLVSRVTRLAPASALIFLACLLQCAPGSGALGGHSAPGYASRRHAYFPRETVCVE